MAVTGIGEELRSERERQGLTLDDIAYRTKIPVRSLEAVEANAFDRLPGLVFTRSFVRLYAVDLDLDAESLVARLPRVDIETAPLPDPPARPGSDSWDPRMTAALVSMVWLITAGVAGTGAWYYYNHYGRNLLATVSAAPAPVFAKSTSHATEPTPAPATFGEPVSGEPAAAPPTSSVAPKSDAAPIKPAPLNTANAANADFDSNRPVQVILTARDVVWVQISADGRTAFVGTLQPNDTRTVSADDQVKILTGNAGGLDISLNGKPLDPLGPKGEIRTVRLTAAGPQFAPRNPPASSPL